MITKDGKGTLADCRIADLSRPADNSWVVSPPRSSCGVWKLGTRTLRHAAWPAPLLAALLAVNAGAECPAALSLRGVGATVAARVRPYVTCLNSTIGTPDQIASHCSEARSTAVHGNNRIERAKLERAVRWLDAMVRQRSDCETQLHVQG